MAPAPPFADRPLLSAELHYFRVPRDDWELMLARMRQLGANTIATCVPWSWHAPRRDTLDLDGRTHPQRDLAGFVRLCGRMGFRVLLKPGPIAGAGLLAGGVPPWLLVEQPEILARQADGQPWRHPADGLPRPSLLHPRYLEEARRWISAFSGAALPLQSPAGPVVAIQPDVGLDHRPPTTDHRNDQERGGEGERGRPANLQSPISNLHPPSSILHPPSSMAVEAVALVMAWLREDGWTVPLCHELPGEPMDGSADLAGLARVAGWAGYNAYAEAGPEPLEAGAFEEQFSSTCWRIRLLRQLNPAYPAFISAIGASHDRVFAAPFLGGAVGFNVYAGPQAAPDHPAVAAPSWAIDALVRPDGSVPPRFWNARLFFALLGAAGADFACAGVPAAIALGYAPTTERVGRRGAGAMPPEALAGCDQAARTRALAERLRHAGTAFDVLDLDAATPDELERYALVVVPAAAILARATQEKLARCPHLALVGDARTRYDEHLAPCTILDDEEKRRGGEGERGRSQLSPSPPLPLSPSPLRLPEDVDGARLAGLAEERGATARYAWADGPDVDVGMRYGGDFIYLFLFNRRLVQYSGTLAYRGPDGAVQHLHVAIGGRRVGVVMLRDDDVLGAALGGDGSEGSWLVRGMRSSVVFSGGAGVVVPCGAGLLLSAPQSGRFQVRRAQGWGNLVAYRLLLSGELLPATLQVEAAHLAVPYVAEDERGQTDLYVVLAEAAAPPILREHLSTLLVGRAAALERAAELAALPVPDQPGGEGALIQARAACVSAAEVFAAVARDLDVLAAADYSAEAYGAAWRSADAACAPALAALALALARCRFEHLAGALDAAEHTMHAAPRGVMEALHTLQKLRMR